MLRTPPDILITTPESLFLLLTSQARETLRGVETVILDEVHAVAGTKRGSHLALSLERLEGLVETPFQRVGLSATQRPLEEIGRFVAGRAARSELVDAGVRKELDLQVVVPVEDMRELGSTAELTVPPLADGVEMGIGVEQVEPLDLALDLPCDPRAGARAPLDDRLRQQPPARGAPRASHQRARRGGAGTRAPRLARAGAARRRRGAAQGRTDPVPRRDVLARARHRHGRRRPRDPGGEPEVGRARSAARRPRGARPALGLEGPHLPQVQGGPPRVGGRSAGHARRRDRGDAHPAESARRPGPADRRDLRGRGGDGGRAPPARAARVPIRGAVPGAARERPRHARGPLPVRRVRRAPAAHRLGPDRRHGARADGRPPARRHERGDDSRPWPLRRLPLGRRRPGGGARRGDGVRGA